MPSTVAEIFRCQGADYRARMRAHILPSHRRVMEDIVTCRGASCGCAPTASRPAAAQHSSSVCRRPWEPWSPRRLAKLNPKSRRPPNPAVPRPSLPTLVAHGVASRCTSSWCPPRARWQGHPHRRPSDRGGERRHERSTTHATPFTSRPLYTRCDRRGGGATIKIFGSAAMSSTSASTRSPATQPSVLSAGPRAFPGCAQARSHVETARGTPCEMIQTPGAPTASLNQDCMAAARHANP